MTKLDHCKTHQKLCAFVLNFRKFSNDFVEDSLVIGCNRADASITRESTERMTTSANEFARHLLGDHRDITGLSLHVSL